MREEIAELKEASVSWRNKALNLEDRLESWAKTIHHQFGPEHPLNERIYTRFLKRMPHIEERYRFMQKSFSLHEIIGKSLSEIDVQRTYIETVLHVVNIFRDDVSYTVRAELRSPDGRAYYAIDDRELFKGRTDPRFVHWLSREIATGLSREIAR